MKKVPEKGDLVKLVSYYYINNKVDYFFKLKNKICIVFDVVEYGKKAMFGEYYYIKGFCDGYIIKAHLEDIKLLTNEK